MAKRWRKALAVLLIAAGALLTAADACVLTTVLTPKALTGPIAEPLSGFAPAASEPDTVGSNTLVYIGITWRELEPEKGKFAFSDIDAQNNVSRWRSEGKHAVLRFLCDDPADSKHMDIPDWLYKETGGDGDWYSTSYGKGYSPNYSNPKFIAAHKLAIEALGGHYGPDGFVCYVQFGSLGHWGEWHTKYESGIRKLPLDPVREQYVEPYLSAFPSVRFLMRRPFSTAASHGFGLYNDVTGDPGETQDWLGWIAHGGEYDQTGEANALVPMPDAWKTAPVGGELTSNYTPKALLKDNLDRTLALVRASHMTFLGPMCPVNDDTGSGYTDGVQALQACLGPRVRVSRAELNEYLLTPGKLEVSLSFVNDGAAPFYRPWPVQLMLLDSSGSVALSRTLDFDLRSVVDGNEVHCSAYLDTSGLPSGVYQVAVAAHDPDADMQAFVFAMEGVQSDGACVLGEWRKG